MTNDVVPYIYVLVLVAYKITKMATITSCTISYIKDNKILITCQIYLKYNHLHYSINKNNKNISLLATSWKSGKCKICKSSK